MNIDTGVRGDRAEHLDTATFNQNDMCIIAHEAFFLFRIGNYAHILKAFGAEVADQAVTATLERLASMVGKDGSVALCRHDVIGVRQAQTQTLDQELVSEQCDAWLRLICRTLPLVPIDCGESTVHVWMSGFWTFQKDRGEHSNLRWEFPYACPRQGQAGWAEQYRSDMVNASRVLAALGDPEASDGECGTAIRPFWQRVHSASDGATQFFEALARLPECNGKPSSIAACILSMERTGFVRLLDLHMVGQVIAELERTPDIQIAVNLSALSARTDPWWDEVRSKLLKRQDVAARLFLEITETASFSGVSEAIRFVDGMRKLGCRIVLDDFGTGHASIRQLFALSPDIVKIDRLFLRRAGLSDRDREIFVCLAQLAGSAGATVVAEGVETAQQKQIALEAGVDWQQGYLWGPASGGHPRACCTAQSGVPAMSAAL